MNTEVQQAARTRDGSMIVSLTEQPGLTVRVYSALRAAIFSLELAPGTALVERDLAERFGVSKSPVRDALQRLVGEGLVTQTPFKGMSVRVVGPEEADEFYALHAELEQFAVRLATPRLTSVDFDSMRTALSAAPEAIARKDLARLALLNNDFHMTFIRQSGNRVLEETFDSFNGRAFVLNAIGWRWKPDLQIELDQHKAIFDAAVAGDADLAAAAMHYHIDFFRRHFRESWEANAAQPLSRRMS